MSRTSIRPTNLEQVHTYLKSSEGKTLLRERGLRRSWGIITRNDERGDVTIAKLAAQGKTAHPRAFIDLHETGKRGLFRPVGRLKFEADRMSFETFKPDAEHNIRSFESALRQAIRRKNARS